MSLHRLRLCKVDPDGLRQAETEDGGVKPHRGRASEGEGQSLINRVYQKATQARPVMTRGRRGPCVAVCPVFYFCGATRSENKI